MKTLPIVLFFVCPYPIHSFVLWPVFHPKEFVTTKVSGANVLLQSNRALYDVDTYQLMNTVTDLCTITNIFSNLPAKPSNISEITFITKCARINYVFSNMKELVQHQLFNPNASVVIVSSGFQQENDEPIFFEEFSNAYMCRGNVNLLLIDLSKGLDPLANWATYDFEAVADLLSDALIDLSGLIDYKLIHLIGHSLGAHIVGLAARIFKVVTGKVIERITGLDPAQACHGIAAMSEGLQHGDARFIDVIHTNPGGLGTSTDFGTIDFYPNGFDIQVGCLEIFCSHNRAWQYYVETVYPGNEQSFIAKECFDLQELDNKKCDGQNIAMGLEVPLNLEGRFYLDTNAKSPYGKKHQKSVIFQQDTCGRCNS